MPDETSRAILYLLYEGRTFDEIFGLHPNLTVLDVSRAAGEGLRALEQEATLRVETAASGASEDQDARDRPQATPRVETRAERIARVRLRHPHAFEPWSEEEDARLVARWTEGARMSELVEALGRPSGALRMRLQKLLGGEWREKGGPS